MENKYRLLTEDELTSLEPEFIQYLASNGIDATKWEELLEEDEVTVDLHISSFSDIVMQKSLENIEYIEHRTSNDLKLFHFGQDEAFLIAVKSQPLDLENIEFFTPEQIQQTKLFKANKKYTRSREEELYDLLNKGCVISKGTLYKQLKQLVGNM